MLDRLGDACVDVVRRWLPDPFVFALILTVVTGATATVWVGARPAEIIVGWYDGFWMLLEFGMQMVLILTTGFAIALSAPVTALIDRIADRIRRPGTVYLTVLVGGGALVFVSWGWVVLSAVFARELASRIRGLDYPYLIACTYLSSNAWVVGLSSSIPLLLNTPGNFLIEAGLLPGTISVGETLGSPLNLMVASVYLVVSPIVMWLVRPRGAIIELRDIRIDPAASSAPTVADAADAARIDPPTPSDRLNASAMLQIPVAATGLGFVALRFVRRGPDLDLNVMIFVFLMLGLLLHRTPMRYVVAMRRACADISGIVFQYPFYAGIMGIMMATGLAKAMASWLTSVASLEMLPVAAFLMGGLVNLSIPSAGGEWAVVGPPLVEAVRDLVGSAPTGELERHVARVAMAVAYGETLTNLVQPFFLLSVLPVMGVGVRIQARDLMGYVLAPFVVLFIVIGLLVAVVPV